MNTNRRGFLKALGALGAGLLVDPAAELLVPERKIWVVGTDFRTTPATLRQQRLEAPWILELPEALCGDDKKVDVLCEYFNTTAGKEALAATMVQPLRAELEYQAIGRQTFRIETLPDNFFAFRDLEF